MVSLHKGRDQKHLVDILNLSQVDHCVHTLWHTAWIDLSSFLSCYRGTNDKGSQIVKKLHQRPRISTLFSSHIFIISYWSNLCKFFLATCSEEQFSGQSSLTVLPWNLTSNLVFSIWRDFCTIGWIRQIGQNHTCMNRIQLQPHTSTENIVV